MTQRLLALLQVCLVSLVIYVYMYMYVEAPLADALADACA